MSLAFANVAEELRRQYSVGYYPKRPGQPGERRQIKVRSPGGEGERERAARCRA